MGLKVMRWHLRHAASKKYQVNIILNSLSGIAVEELGEEMEVIVNVKWKGPRGALGPRFGIKRAHSLSRLVGHDGTVVWDQSFDNICTFAATKDGRFQPWPVSLVVCKIRNVPGSLRSKPFIIGTVLVDLGELVRHSNLNRESKKLPVICNFGGSDSEATLSISISLVELRNTFEGFESVQKLVAPAIACMGEPMRDSDDEDKSSTRKGNSLTRLSCGTNEGPSPDVLGAAVDFNLCPAYHEEKIPSSGKESLRGYYSKRFDFDSMESLEVDDFVDELLLGKSISYGTLAGANLIAEEVIPFHRKEGVVSDADDHVMTVHSGATLPKMIAESSVLPETEFSFPSSLSVRSVLSWRKRKLSFRSPHSRGEPLLNKAYGEEGGDEIDWDRRQSDSLSAEEKLLVVSSSKSQEPDSRVPPSATYSEVLNFGDECFTVGSWELKDLVSRDGLIKLSANVFFASFDQRSESAAGESACTALVAVIVDWLHTHPGLMPSKAEFDMLIRDGSAEWRKLWEVEAYKSRFPDRHFDLETVLKAGVRPLAVNSERSFVGFFQPEGRDELGEAFDFLRHAMTFDGVWDAIERCGPAVYIVSWNDHFFVLRFEEHCCYIIDTLGERLYEGCNQAYILHFDENTTLSNQRRKPFKDSKSSTARAGELEISTAEETNKKKFKQAEMQAKNREPADDFNVVDLSMVEVHTGKGACRQFVKGFFAAMQLGEVELEARKYALGKCKHTSIYRKLQIEFHYARALEVPSIT